ncbi:Wzz/FepE/Etk N-terminal domain-containing protein [Candidatus Protofrankia californiensis]|uniref:Wzz/FepE/Etk N-terminal domain-containing protein n=1 Tax=Candidatus Protofrankia californiensis TaxID=1839754 RepID=UPI001040FC0B|nr:Wzz/FepE/Etk N-terminal domain-containing protein [Candidatus Protofrankia californiensis]
MEPPAGRPTTLSAALRRDDPSQGRDDERHSDIRALRAHRLLVVVVVLAALGGGLLVLALRPTAYHAKAELLVSPLTKDDSSLLGLPLVRDLGDPIRTIQTAAAALKNRDIAEVAATRLGVPWTAERVQRAVDVMPKGQTNILEVKASAPEAKTAADVANAYAHSLIDVRQVTLQRLVDSSILMIRTRLDALQNQQNGVPDQQGATAAALEQWLIELEQVRNSGDPTVSLSQDASIPTSAAGAPAWLVLTITTLAGIVLGAGAAVATERFAHAHHGQKSSTQKSFAQKNVEQESFEAAASGTKAGSGTTDGVALMSRPPASTSTPAADALDGQPIGPSR